jgi:hypothetical protein
VTVNDHDGIEPNGVDEEVEAAIGDEEVDWAILEKSLFEIFERKTPPGVIPYLKKLGRVNDVLMNESEAVRPYSASGLPGGIVQLNNDLPTIIIPDLHARMDLFLSTMGFELEEGCTVLQNLARGAVQVVCVGDGFHAEGRAVERWKKAYTEFASNYKKHRNMDEEMRESLGVMEMVIEVKSACPDHFHFLKGNHENVANEQGNGNHPFRKYAYEGPMVAQYVRQFYGDEFFEAYYEFERNLPLLAIGRNFLISHSEPGQFYDRDAILEYRDLPDVIEGLTWTANDEAEDDSVSRMLAYYLDIGEEGVTFYFGGHRPVRERYNLRADGKYVQIHNPDRFIIALLYPDRALELDGDIIEIENLTAGGLRSENHRKACMD